jgi:DNA-binding Lrp family transcriptional regulator
MPVDLAVKPYKREPFSIIPKSMLDDKRLTGNEILVYSAIDYYSNGRGDAWPSLVSIAEKAHVSRRTVIRSLKHLEELGYLRKTIRRKQGNVEFDSSIYQIKFRAKSGSEMGGSATQTPGSVSVTPGVVSEWHRNDKYLKGYPLNENKGAPDAAPLKGLLTEKAPQAKELAGPQEETLFLGREYSREEMQDARNAIEYFKTLYRRHRGYAHRPVYGESNLQRILHVLDALDCTDAIEGYDTMFQIMRVYFQKDYADCDYSFWHFTKDRIWGYLAFKMEILGHESLFEADGSMVDVIEI